MEIKKTWEEYTPEEKTALLNHWFYYYGGTLMTLKDIEDFRELSTTRQDDIFAHIVTSFIFKDTIQSNLLLMCLRENKIDELFSHSLKPSDIKKGREKDLEDVRCLISDEIHKTFINPEPPVPMDIAIVVDEDEPKQHK